MKYQVCYYITGHGLGHATRCIKVIEYLISVGIQCDVVTNLNILSFIQKNLSVESQHKITLHGRVLDGGAVQTSPLTVDPIATLNNYIPIYEQHEILVQKEITFLIEKKIDIVLCDATPLACRAGHLAQCKVCVISNFTWDYIYTEILAAAIRDTPTDIEEVVLSQYRAVVQSCAEDYSYVDLYLQLPGENPVPSGIPAHRVIPMPLLARHANLSRREARKQLKILPSTNVLLLCFGGFQSHFHLCDHFLPKGWICLSLFSNPEDMPSERFISLPADTYVPDILEASDVVLGKLGYGLLSECLATAIPLLYIRRSYWPEEPHLVHYMRSQQGCISVEEHDFLHGKWELYLFRALLTSRGIRCRGADDDEEEKDVDDGHACDSQHQHVEGGTATDPDTDPDPEGRHTTTAALTTPAPPHCPAAASKLKSSNSSSSRRRRRGSCQRLDTSGRLMKDPTAPAAIIAHVIDLFKSNS